RQAGGGAESTRQPWPRPRADQPLVEEAIGLEAVQPVLAEVEGGERDQRRHERLHLIEPAIIGHQRLDLVEAAIDARLSADARLLDHVPAPRLHGRAAME